MSDDKMSDNLLKDLEDVLSEMLIANEEMEKHISYLMKQSLKIYKNYLM